MTQSRLLNLKVRLLVFLAGKNTLKEMSRLKAYPSKEVVQEERPVRAETARAMSERKKDTTRRFRGISRGLPHGKYTRGGGTSGRGFVLMHNQRSTIGGLSCQPQ